MDMVCMENPPIHKVESEGVAGPALGKLRWKAREAEEIWATRSIVGNSDWRNILEHSRRQLSKNESDETPASEPSESCTPWEREGSEHQLVCAPEVLPATPSYSNVSNQRRDALFWKQKQFRGKAPRNMSLQKALRWFLLRFDDGLAVD